LAGRLADWLIGPEWAGVLRLMVVGMVLAGPRTIAMYLLQAEERAGAFLALSLAELALTVGLNVALVAGARLGVTGVALAGLLTSAMMLLLTLPLLLTRMPAPRQWLRGRRSRPDDLRRLLRYGLPLVSGQVGQILANRLDRSLLAGLGTLGLAGVYDVGYKLGSLQDVIAAAPLNQAWYPYLVNHAARPDIRRVQARVLTYSLAGGMLLAAGLGALAAPALQIAVRNPAYWGGAAVVFIVAVAYAFKGMNSVVGSPMLLLGRTEFNVLWWAVAAASNAALNLLLIPSFSMAGAAWATLLAFALALMVNVLVVHRHYAVDYEWGRLARALLAGALTYRAAILLTMPSPWLTLFTRGTLCLALYPLLLALSGFPAPDEWLALRRLAQSLNRRNP
ncbi:MAG: polysaccharide biosynthesis C-terminal domain-containing protein, partial [Chloroflexi bacterium]|nr:polysaccharide biosynthesis C-terminal domain-containing protein [Chloroflexota bacterium]